MNIVFNPIFGVRMASPMSAEALRSMAQGSVWRHNPWTGKLREHAEMVADPFGHQLVAPDELRASDLENEINRLAGEARIGMQTLHQDTINLLAVGMAKKIDDLVCAGLTRVLGEWSLDTVGDEGLACTRHPGGKSVYEVRGIPFLLIRETRLMDSGASVLTAAFDHRYLVDRRGQPKPGLPDDETVGESVLGDV